MAGAHWLATNRSDFMGEDPTPPPLLAAFDATPQRFRALALERNYLPPEGTAGRPIIRRTLFIWSDSLGSAVVADVDTGTTRLVPPPKGFVGIQAPELLFGHRGTATAMRDGSEKTWSADDGTVQMVDLGTEGKCPSWIVSKDIYTTGRKIECARVHFGVDAQVTLSRVDTTLLGLGVSTERRVARFSIAPQDVWGIRLTAHCPMKPGPNPDVPPAAATHCPACATWPPRVRSS